ncbi:MAG: hypothetical protein ACUVTB_05035 [Candidatus Bathycorpusculaceae bacterium]
MGVSIIIPTLNGEKLLPIILRHLQNYEVIVVDGERVPISCKPRVSGSIIFMRKNAFNSIGGYWENPVGFL